MESKTDKKLNKNKNHGGIRPGAGRKPDITRHLAKIEKFTLQLSSLYRPGLVRLAESYDELMRIAIEKARGGYDNGRPDTIMLRTLISLLPTMIKPDDPEGDSPLSKLMSDIRSKVVNIQVNNYRPESENMGGDNTISPEPVEGTIITRVEETLS